MRTTLLLALFCAACTPHKSPESVPPAPVGEGAFLTDKDVSKPDSYENLSSSGVIDFLRVDPNLEPIWAYEYALDIKCQRKLLTPSVAGDTVTITRNAEEGKCEYYTESAGFGAYVTETHHDSASLFRVRCAGVDLSSLTGASVGYAVTQALLECRRAPQTEVFSHQKYRFLSSSVVPVLSNSKLEGEHETIFAIYGEELNKPCVGNLLEMDPAPGSGVGPSKFIKYQNCHVLYKFEAGEWHYRSYAWKDVMVGLDADRFHLGSVEFRHNNWSGSITYNGTEPPTYEIKEDNVWDGTGFRAGEVLTGSL